MTEAGKFSDGCGTPFALRRIAVALPVDGSSRGICVTYDPAWTFATTASAPKTPEAKVRPPRQTTTGRLSMKKLTAVLIAATLGVTGIAFAQDKKDTKKPTAEECKKAMEAKKELKGCEAEKKEMKK
jgi:hypothetical protein